jgi:hypothetical protein
VWLVIGLGSLSSTSDMDYQFHLLRRGMRTILSIDQPLPHASSCSTPHTLRFYIQIVSGEISIIEEPQSLTDCSPFRLLTLLPPVSSTLLMLSSPLPRPRLTTLVVPSHHQLQTSQILTLIILIDIPILVLDEVNRDSSLLSSFIP